MSSDRTSPISVPNPEGRQRRGSIADLFPKQNPPSQASQPKQRRLSITTLGLSGSPTSAQTFGNFRRGSIASSIGSTPNEDAVEDTEGTSPNSQFARRASFGAQALRDARRGSIGGSIGNGRIPPPSVVGPRRSPPRGSAIVATRSPGSHASLITERKRSNASDQEGFNWSEALRTRAERAPSISGGPPRQNTGHQRATSIGSMETPAREFSRQPKQNKPDFFQEKILRGDFMD